MVNAARILLCGMLAALLAGGAAAQQARPARNLAVGAADANEPRTALVIGNSGYSESPLANPTNDATDVARALGELGFRVTLKTNASRRQMEEAIRELGAQLRRGGVGFFYYAGHGIQSKGANYLVPVAANIRSEADLRYEAVDANMVLSQMDEAGNRVNIVVLDACRNNPFGRSFRSAAQGLAQMEAARGSYIAFATAPGSVAADGNGRNGTYTKHLLSSLKQPDTDIDKVFRRVAAQVARETDNKQVPWTSSSLTGDFYFRPPNGAPPVSVTNTPAADPAALELAFWESVKDSRNADEIGAYLEQYPRGKFAALARARLKALQAVQPAVTPPVQVAIVKPTTIAQPKPPVAAISNTIAALRAGTSFRDCDACPEMVVIPAGSFMMGSSEEGQAQNEGPQHRVTIGYPLAVGKFEITFDEWDACVRDSGCSLNPPEQGWGRGRRPVIHVSWNDAQQYVQWLARKTGKRYRLLTEAEWEYVARAGTTTAFNTGASISPQQANYNAVESFAGSPTATTPRQTAPVGSYAANAFGLYDVHGNVWEWTEDCWNANYNGAPPDGSAWTSGECDRRVLRGGSWNLSPQIMRVAYRFRLITGFRNFDLGFRLARTD